MKFDEGERGQLLGGVKDNILPTTTIPILIQIYYGLYFAPTQPNNPFGFEFSLIEPSFTDVEKVLTLPSPSPSRLLFYRTQVSLGSGLWVPVSVCLRTL